MSLNGFAEVRGGPPRAEFEPRYSKAMAASVERDHYLFGALDSSAKNRIKVKEVNYGYEEPEGVFLTRWILR